MEKNDAKSKYFWSHLENWDLEKLMPERGKKQKAYIRDVFTPLLKKTDIIGELACASGLFTLEVAPFVHEIDAFDISEPLIQRAKENAHAQGIDSIHFAVAQAEDIQFPRTYNHFMCLGLFTYIESDIVVKDILAKIYDNLVQNDGGGLPHC